MKRTFLFTNSDFNATLKRVIKRGDTIIGVDGGVDTLFNIDLVPDVIIGDFDSIKLDNKYLASDNIKKISHPPEKDFTDTELAVDYAINKDSKSIIIVNDMQNRTDHALGIIATLANLHQQGIHSMILSNHQALLFLNTSTEIKLKVGLEVSLIPFSSEVKGITTSGLYYPLKNESLYSTSARGVSNKTNSDRQTITFDQGMLLLVINFVRIDDILLLF